MAQLGSLRTKANNMSARLQALQNDSQVTAENVNSLRGMLRETEAQFSDLWRQHESLRAQLADVLARLPEIVQGEINAAVPAISASVAQSVFDQQFQKFSQSLYYDVDHALKSFRGDLDNLKERVDALQNDVSFLMKEFLAGRLTENVGFFGLSIGGDYLASAWQPRVGVEYEMLLPTSPLFNKSGSVFVELARINWKETRDYPTLPGLDPIKIQDNNDLMLLLIGGRVFIQGWNNELQPYIGVAYGHSVAGKENTYSQNFAIGTEYFRQATRVAFEIRWDYFSKIERTEATFNPFGSASVKSFSEERNAWYAGIKIAFR